MNSPLKWYGGKSRQVSWLVGLTPTHICCEEPYGGALWYTLGKNPEGISEVVNDISLDLTNFWWCLRDGKTFRKMKRYLEATPFSEIEYGAAVMAQQRRVNSKLPDPIRAAQFFIHCRQSRAGGLKTFATLTKNRVRRKMNEQASAWWTAIDGLEGVRDRLKNIVILNKPALDVIRILDAPATHHYLDPPYPHSTRTTTDAYAHEMTIEDHEELLDLIDKGSLRGTVMISGKRCELYDNRLKNWNRKDVEVPLDTAGGKTKRRVTECVWMNYGPKQIKNSATK